MRTPGNKEAAPPSPVSPVTRLDQRFLRYFVQPRHLDSAATRRMTINAAELRGIRPCEE